MRATIITPTLDGTGEDHGSCTNGGLLPSDPPGKDLQFGTLPFILVGLTNVVLVPTLVLATCTAVFPTTDCCACEWCAG